MNFPNNRADMQESQILSGFHPLTATPARTALVFDACQAGVILRAVLFVEVAVAVAAIAALPRPPRLPTVPAR